MPLFGRNIKKMKENNDIQGLVKELTNKNRTIRSEVIGALHDLKNVEGLSEALKNDVVGVRIEAAEALKSISDPKAIAVLTKYLFDLLKFGERDDQIEAILVIQARAPERFLPFNVDPKGVRTKLSLETYYPALLEVIRQHKSVASVWYATVALIELGDRNDEVLSPFIKLTDKWINDLDTEGVECVPTWALAKAINEETLRALSYFKGNQTAVDAAVNALEGRLFGWYIAEDSEAERAQLRILQGIFRDKSTRERMEYEARQGRQDIMEALEDFEKLTFNEVKVKSAIYALGSLGNPSTRERLEYLKERGSEAARKAAKVALELFGEASYDEIKERSESK